MTHHLPDKSYGGELSHDAPQENIDRLCRELDCDLAIYGHIHMQLQRYSSDGRLVLNPGSIGMPYFPYKGFRRDLRAQYAIITLDELGLSTVSFHKVDFDKEKELRLAKQAQLPYLESYEALLYRGEKHTHRADILDVFNRKYGYAAAVMEYFHLTQEIASEK